MMKINGMKSMAIAAIACLCFAAPVSSFAQRYSHDDYRFVRDDLRGEANSVERESNSFRAYFEHNFRDNGHQRRGNRPDSYGYPQHEGRNGNMTLQDTIQNLDEGFERLRAEIDRHGRTRQARGMMDDIVNHMRDVDVRIDRVGDFYTFGRDRNWRYKSSELFNRWVDLKADINMLARQIGGRGR